MKSITLTPAEVKIVLAAVLFAASTDLEANWDEATDTKFLNIAMKIAKQTQVTDVSKYLGDDLLNAGDFSGHIADDIETLEKIRKTFTLGKGDTTCD